MIESMPREFGRYATKIEKTAENLWHVVPNPSRYQRKMHMQQRDSTAGMQRAKKGSKISIELMRGKREKRLSAVPAPGLCVLRAFEQVLNRHTSWIVIPQRGHEVRVNIELRWCKS